MAIDKFIKKLLPFKYKRAVKEKLGVPSLHWSLQNLKKKNFNPVTVLDIGAYEGYWTIDLLEVFPAAKVLMVEAQKSKVPFLEKIRKQYPNTDFAISLLSAANDDEKYFCENETASHVRESPVQGVPGYILKTQTLDSLIQKKNFALPDLIKLDVQGHEMEVLKGAETSLQHAAVCLLEISLFDFGDGTPLLQEMLNFMDTKGFRAYDISQFMRRPLDKALFQIDMFFVKKDSFLTADKSW